MSQSQNRTIAVVCLIVVLLAGAAVNARFWKIDTKTQDIYYSWVESERILHGENPYARVLTGNMRDNEKYATYFPLSYELGVLTELAGLRDYESWIAFWRAIFLVCNLAIGATLFLLVYPRGKLLAAIFAAAFWLFNRWTIHVSVIAHLDFPPILFLILSLALFRRHRWVSLLLFSLSLGIKQIGIFLVPLYLVWAWQSADRNRVRQTLLALAVIASLPILSSLPFIVWNFEGFMKSMLFEAVRSPSDHFGTISVGALMGWSGLLGRLPMFAVMLLATALAWRRRIGPYIATLFVLATFIDYNSVLFPQYMVWVVPFIPLVMCDLWDAVQAKALPRPTV